MSNGFNELGIAPPILRALEEMGFESPTEVQYRAIPHILNGEDLIVRSKTGSGKTAVFGVSMLQMIDPHEARLQGLILTPTRELAVQIDNDLKRIGAHLPHRTTAVYGQHSQSIEIQELRKKVSIVTGTPGRVYDHIEQRNLKTGHIRFLVLDEADRMLDMGFYDQVLRIVQTLPKNRITLLFSATIPDEIHRLCVRYMKDPHTIEIESPTKTVDTIKQLYYRMEKNEKRTQLNRILLMERPKSCMIFCNTKIAVDQVQRFLTGKGYASRAIHGDIPQAKRLKTMHEFKEGKFNLLVATDVAARGIHIDDLSLVVNYDVPAEKDGYVHRIGRTGRAGNGGLAITLVTRDDIMTLYEIEEHIGSLIEEAELPSDAEFDSQRQEAEKWMMENAGKADTDEHASRQRPGAQAGRSGNKRRRSHRDRHEDMPGKAGAERQVSRERRDGSSIRPSRPAQSVRKPDSQAVKPVQEVKASAAPRAKNYINAKKPLKIAEPAQTMNPPARKPFIRRVIQRIFGR